MLKLTRSALMLWLCLMLISSAFAESTPVTLSVPGVAGFTIGSAVRVPLPVNPGQHILVTASGCTVSWGPRCVDPNGHGEPPIATIDGIITYSLIGRWGTSSGTVTPSFFVGSSAPLTAPAAGSGPYYLWLAVNDNNFSDNSGAFSVTVAMTECVVPPGELATRLNLRTLIAFGCGTSSGSLETRDLNGDGYLDKRVMDDIFDGVGNKISVWCMGASVPEYRMWYTTVGDETYFAGGCPFCGGWNMPIDIYFGKLQSTNTSCILSTRWTSTEGGAITDPNTGARYGERGFDCNRIPGVIEYVDFFFDANTLVGTRRDGHRSKPTITSTQTVTKAGPPLGSIPVGSAPMEIGNLHPADLNADGTVNALDVGVMQAAIGSSVGEVRYDPRADIDGNGAVNFIDYQLWLSSTRVR